MSYRPKVKSNTTGTLVDLPLDAQTISGVALSGLLQTSAIGTTSGKIPSLDSNGKLATSVYNNQTIKADNVTFGASAAINLKSGTGVDLTSNTSDNSITFSIDDDVVAKWNVGPNDDNQYFIAGNKLIVFEDGARVFVPESEYDGDIDAWYGAFGIWLTSDADIKLKFPFTKADGTYTLATTSDIPTAGTTATTYCAGNDTRLSDSRTPTSHTHGNITNDGKITSTAVTSATGVLVYDSNNKIQRAASSNARTIIGAQATLVSGTNIKTVNGYSLLGSGNIDISGGGGSSYYHHMTKITQNAGGSEIYLVIHWWSEDFQNPVTKSNFYDALDESDTLTWSITGYIRYQSAYRQICRIVSYYEYDEGDIYGFTVSYASGGSQLLGANYDLEDYSITITDVII